MMKGIRKLLGLFLGVTLAAGTVTMPVNAEGENQESKVKITPTEIVADGVFNNGGYGSLKIYGEDDHDNFQVIKAPQAALIDREGNFVFPYKETRLRYYYDNGIVSLIGERPYLNYTLRGLPDPVGFYNLDGSKAFELDCFGATKMVDGLSFVQNVLNREDVFNSVIDAYIVDRNGNRVYTFDRSFCDVIGGGVGTFDIDELYSECSAAYFGNGLLLCWENEGGCRIFYVNAKGEKVIELGDEFNDARVFFEGYAAVQKDKWGYMDTTGKIVINCQYESAGDFIDGLAPVKKDGKWGYINTKGEVVIPFEYEGVCDSGDGLASVKKDGKYGLVDYENNVVVPFEYDDISSYVGGVSYGIKDGKISIITGYTKKNPFKDVWQSDYFFNAVLWAAENGITAGTSATTFSPNDPCTRAQVVTFLWRAAGSPEPKSGENPFTDVNAGTYYYNAVLWAVENGITAGTSKDTFSPDAACTRGQVVSFLYRYEGNNKAEGAENPFADVKEGAYYYDPVLWAVKNGITAGTSKDTFSPDATCTRGQIVTFLYRDLVK